MPVTDAEYGNTQAKNARVYARASFLEHRGRTAGKNNTDWLERSDFRERCVKREDVCSHSELAHPPCNQVRELATEIEHDDHNAS